MTSDRCTYQRQINRFVIVSNRLPVILKKEKNGVWRVEQGSGGLVTALDPILRERGGVWIGWPGSTDEMSMCNPHAIDDVTLGYGIEPVLLSEEEVDGYYRGFANEIVWPLFHDMGTRCDFDPVSWEAYQTVNCKFAQVVAQNATVGDYIWVHDYHLMLVATYLRELGIEQQLSFFLHTPFPAVDIFIKLPWWRQILKGLMTYDFLGFQTARDRNNFLDCANALHNMEDLDTERPVITLETASRNIGVGSFGISIDVDEFDRQAREPTVEKRMRKLRQELSGDKLILGVDRLDYSKGIPEKLKGFQRALERFPELHSKVILAQVVVPSREDISEYQDLKAEIEGLVSQINGRFTTPGWVPIHYLFQSLDRHELLAFYRAADIALVTPLKDGMNLIAKEYCTANIDNNGVLILSQFAGAARQLGSHALLVNPYDRDGVADAIRNACQMHWTHRQSRIFSLRMAIQSQDVFRWLNRFLEASLRREGGTVAKCSGIKQQAIQQLAEHSASLV